MVGPNATAASEPAPRASVARNATSMVVGQLGAKAVAFGVAVLLARYLGSRDYGRYSFIATYVLLFSAAGDLGLTLLVMREVGRDHTLAPRYLSSYLAVQAAVALLLLIVPVGTIWLSGAAPVLRLGVAIAACALAVETLSRPFSAILLSLERMSLNAVVIGGTSLASSTAVLAGLAAHRSLLYFVAVSLLAAVVQVSLAATLCLGYGARPAGGIEPRAIRRLLAQAVPYALLASFTILYNRVDVLLLAGLRGDRVVGWYAAAAKPTEALLLIPANVVGAFLPQMARGHEANEGLMAPVAGRAMRVLLPLGLVIGLLGSLLGPLVVRRLYGPAYGPTGLALGILVWSVALACPNTVLAYGLQAARRTGLLAALIAGNLGLNIALNVILIPRFSLIGACAATVACEAVLLALLAMAFRRYAGPLPFSRETIWPLLAGGCGAVAAGMLAGAGPLVQSAGACSLFVAVLLGGHYRLGHGSHRATPV